MTNVGSDRAQLAHMAKRTKAALEAESLDVRERRRHSYPANTDDLGRKTLRRPGLPLRGRGICPAVNLVLRGCLTNVCQHCATKHRCTTGKERRTTRWEHEHISNPCNTGTMSTRRRYAIGAKPLSIRSAR